MTHAASRVYHDHHLTRRGPRINETKKKGFGKGNWGTLEDEMEMGEDFIKEESRSPESKPIPIAASNHRGHDTVIKTNITTTNNTKTTHKPTTIKTK